MKADGLQNTPKKRRVLPTSAASRFALAGLAFLAACSPASQPVAATRSVGLPTLILPAQTEAAPTAVGLIPASLTRQEQLLTQSGYAITESAQGVSLVSRVGKTVLRSQESDTIIIRDKNGQEIEYAQGMLQQPSNFSSGNLVNFFVRQGVATTAWFQTLGGSSFASGNIESKIPFTTCTPPLCTPALIATDPLGTVDSPGFALTSTGSVVTSDTGGIYIHESDGRSNAHSQSLNR